jgi:UDPglucose 6-dehydrogenase
MIKLLSKNRPYRSYSRTLQTILDSTGNGVKFEVLSNPEFLAEGTAIEDLLHADRVLMVENRLKVV